MKEKCSSESPVDQALIKLLTDPDIASDLAALAKNAPQQGDIKDFLEFLCKVYQHAQTIQAISPSVAKQQLQVLAQSADRLATAIFEHKQLLETATNLRYLMERTTSDNPSRFMRTHRAGLRRAQYQTQSDRMDLSQILEAFSEDIHEELRFLPKRINTLDGGKDASIRYQIRVLKRAYENLFGQSEYALLSRLLTVINGEEISSSRIRKTRI